MRIFIFDDEPETLETLEMYLNCEGNELYSFLSYREAVKFARNTSGNIDVAIVDGAIDNNKEVGMELAAILRSKNPDARIIILTGFSELTERAMLDRYRIDFKEKPAGVLDIVKEYGCLQ